MNNTCYLPLTATPWKQSEAYREILPESPGLAGIIRCFWGSERPYRDRGEKPAGTLVIPDTCVDVIYDIDYTSNTITGRFCGINDSSFVTCGGREPGHLVSVFGIRFYAWAFSAFSEDSLKGTVNGFYDVRSRFGRLDRILGQQLFEVDSLDERGRLVEHMLLGQAAPWRRQDTVEQAVGQVLGHKGALSVEELARECLISSRQLERLSHEYMGIPPKKFCSLVRYQYLWSEIVRSFDFHILDAVSKYGYTDQSHLMREFKCYHTMDIRSAVRLARGAEEI